MAPDELPFFASKAAGIIAAYDGTWTEEGAKMLIQQVRDEAIDELLQGNEGSCWGAPVGVAAEPCDKDCTICANTVGTLSDTVEG